MILIKGIKEFMTVNNLSLNNPDFSIELRYACNAAEKSTKFLNYLIRHSIDTTPAYKLDNTPVTLADYGSQIVILFQLIGEFPNDYFLGEENLSGVRIHHKQSGNTINDSSFAPLTEGYLID